MNPRHPVYLGDLRIVRERIAHLDRLRGARILITGATGLVGSCLTDLLAGAYPDLTVFALCRDPARAEGRFSQNVHLLAGDVTERLPVLPEADFIVHAASNAHPAAFSADPVGTMRANIFGTQNLLEMLRREGHGRMLFISSGEIYGENPAVTDGFSEDSFGKIDPMNPRSCYPESKRAAETLCAAYARQYGTDALCARLCYVYGPNLSPSNTRADAQFLRKALAKEDIVLKSMGTQVRSYCYAADAAAALVTILLQGKTGEAYNVANPGSISSIRGYAETLARLAGVRVTFDLPSEAERQGYSVVTRAVQKADKLCALGWTPMFDLAQGLAHTLSILSEEDA